LRGYVEYERERAGSQKNWEWFQWLAEQIDQHSKARTSLAVGAHEAYRDWRPGFRSVLRSLSADASLTRLSLICVGVQAANPKTNAGFSFAWMQKNESGEGLTPISSVMRLIIVKSSSRFSQATMFNPASGTCKVKRSPSNSLNCLIKKSRRSA